jgi:hypothetical protein
MKLALVKTGQVAATAVVVEDVGVVVAATVAVVEAVEVAVVVTAAAAAAVAVVVAAAAVLVAVAASAGTKLNTQDSKRGLVFQAALFLSCSRLPTWIRHHSSPPRRAR